MLDEFHSFDVEKTIVWIDPLDGTTDFVKGNLSAVTVLIGLAIEGIPKIGVVHNPFIINENDGKGLTIFGTLEHGAFILDYDKSMTLEQLEQRKPRYMEPFDQSIIYDDLHNIKIAASLNHFN